MYERLGAVTEELYDKTAAVNLKGPFGSACWRPPMAAHGGGSIINIGTTGSLVASVQNCPTPAPRWGSTPSPSAWPRRSHRRSGSTPSPAFRTDATVAWADQIGPTVVPLGRIGEPDEIAPSPSLASAASASPRGPSSAWTGASPARCRRPARRGDGDPRRRRPRPGAGPAARSSREHRLRWRDRVRRPAACLLLIARKNPHCMKTLPVADHRHRLEALRAETVERLAAASTTRR